MELSRTLIGMSGGVDSSVAAQLLLQQGPCTGATMQLYGDVGSAVEDARSVCNRLNMEHLTLDLQKEFEAMVIQDFIRAYETGLTPNPCIRCNSTLKFGILLEQALAMGFDAVATGHYARIRKDPDTGRYLLYKAADQKKIRPIFWLA